LLPIKGVHNYLSAQKEVTQQNMDYPNKIGRTEEYVDDQLISGTVLLGALIIVNAILLLNWLGIISFI